MRMLILSFAIVMTLVMSACGSSSVEEVVGEDAAETVAAVQTQISQLSADIEASPAADQLASAWQTAQQEFTAAAAAVQSETDLDGDALQAGIDSFQSTLDGLGDEVGDEVSAGWAQLRGLLEDLTS